MALLGHLIKKLIDLKYDFVPQQPADAEAAQREQLTRLLERARDTAFGRHFKFAEMLESGVPYPIFKHRVPIYDYHRMEAEWWERQQQEDDITWPGRPRYFALSSGTTGSKSKRIPVTDDMLASIQSVSRAQAESLANFDLPPEFFERDILALSSSAHLQEKDGHLEGEISGINVSNLPGYAHSFYKPGLEIAQIDNWDERIAAIVREAPNWDVGAIAGIPAWIQLMLKAIIDHYKLANIHEIWPGLRVYATGGVAYAPYRESFDALLGKPLIIMDTYLASEGFFAYNARPDTEAMQLAVTNGIFYEFVPFDKTGFDPQGNLLEHPQVVPLWEVEEGKNYAMLISTCAGAWRYLIGDTVRFTNLERQELVITGRTKYFLNVVGSQLSEEKINAAISALAEQTGAIIKEFGVAAVHNEAGEYIHQWVLGLETDALNEEEAARRLDDTLQEMNKNYKVARSQALKGVRVRIVPVDRLYSWLESRKSKGGQIKMPKVMAEEQMLDLLDFAGQPQPSPV